MKSNWNSLSKSVWIRVRCISSWNNVTDSINKLHHILNLDKLQSCLLDINECLSNPCRNGGICVNGQNRYSCTCLPGYHGDNCQQGKLNIGLLQKSCLRTTVWFKKNKVLFSWTTTWLQFLVLHQNIWLFIVATIWKHVFWLVKWSKS